MCMWCRFVTGWLVENVWKNIWTWISTAWRTCSSYPCAWWCLCCNRWACWIFLIVLTVLAAVMFALLVIIANLVCIVCYVVCVIVCALPSIVGQPRCYALCAGDPPPDDGPSSSGPGPGTGVGPQPGTGPGTGTGTGTNLRRTADSREDGNVLDVLAGLTQWPRLLTHLGPVFRNPASMESVPPAVRGIVGRYDRACGCAQGQVGAAAAITMFAALCFAGHGAWLGSGWISLVGTGFGFAVAGSMLGKAVGAVHARAVLRRELRAYFSGLDSAPAEAG